MKFVPVFLVISTGHILSTFAQEELCTTQCWDCFDAGYECCYPDIPKCQDETGDELTTQRCTFDAGGDCWNKNGMYFYPDGIFGNGTPVMCQPINQK
ncbi:hypothetical protein FE257_011010 [Aspergillus nanangensis]|uniref:Uncharacterized protein n=1 Tax=Aspergillus nanangensis TaxID=2582783 RepID=A0AAD4GRT1_ASPNN|nr:hypothetical protein FE257_011010 [Aspergillus nanangensis]